MKQRWEREHDAKCASSRRLMEAIPKRDVEVVRTALWPRLSPRLRRWRPVDLPGLLHVDGQNP